MKAREGERKREREEEGGREKESEIYYKNWLIQLWKPKSTKIPSGEKIKIKRETP